MGLVYAVRVTLQKQDIMVNGRLLPLGPGMAASAEVKTGLTERSVVDVRSAARNVNADMGVKHAFCECDWRVLGQIYSTKGALSHGKYPVPVRTTFLRPAEAIGDSEHKEEPLAG